MMRRPRPKNRAFIWIFFILLFAILVAQIRHTSQRHHEIPYCPPDPTDCD